MDDNANVRPPSSPEGQPVPLEAPEGQQPVPAEPAAGPAAPEAPTPPVDFQPQQPSGQPYPGYPNAPLYASQPPMASPNAPNSGKAVAALVCGICAIVFAGTVIIGIALGVVAIVLAAQYVKAFGKDGKALGGKVCGIAGIVLSIVMLVLYLLLGTFVVQAALDYANDTPRQSRGIAVPDADLSQPPSKAPDANQTAAVTEAKQAVAVELDKVKSPDQTTLGIIAREAETEFADDLGFSLTEIGIDPAEFAAWLAEGMDYTISDDDVRLRADGEGEVRVAAQAKSYKELARGLAGQTAAYVSAERLDHRATVAPLDDATKAALFDLVRASMDRVVPVQTAFSVDVMKVKGAWTVEHGELDSVIGDVFDL